MFRHRSSEREPASADLWLVCGLGNPGPEYAPTRHNVGYLVADELVARIGGSLRTHRATRTLLADGRLAAEGGGAPQRIAVMRGRTYMNESGGPVSAVLRYYGLGPERLIVIHDELDLPYGSLRTKLGGGDNGHNGLRSVRRSLGTGDFFRVRLGVGRPPGRQDPAEFVLKPFAAVERRELDLHVQRAADCTESLATRGLEPTQSAYNT